MSKKEHSNVHEKKKKPAPEKDMEALLAEFTLQDSLPNSELELPAMVSARREASWREIVEESEQRVAEIQRNIRSKHEPPLHTIYNDMESEYLQTHVFPYLLPALESTLFTAQKWRVMTNQHSIFNGVDHVAQLLWNNNPRHPKRLKDNLYIFNMPWVMDMLREKLVE